ncbi:MAG: hypothetical protein NZ700_09950 [Gemmataceae bacterium]|nr:hypothetical protein [Gemmataceae bacterium]MDW8264877.1 hypothetical protein [Gemmataceae bacterium]
MKKSFDHIGIPTTEPHPGESWVAFSEVWVTNPRLHPQRIEYIRPKNPPRLSPRDGAIWKLWHWPHVAYRVDDLAAALAGEEVVYGPFEPGGFGQVAFVHKDGVIIEYMQYTDVGQWFGQPNPPGFDPAEYWPGF